jgi:hypothetical protein
MFIFLPQLVLKWHVKRKVTLSNDCMLVLDPERKIVIDRFPYMIRTILEPTPT